MNPSKKQGSSRAGPRRADAESGRSFSDILYLICPSDASLFDDNFPDFIGKHGFGKVEKSVILRGFFGFGAERKSWDVLERGKSSRKAKKAVPRGRSQRCFRASAARPGSPQTPVLRRRGRRPRRPVPVRRKPRLEIVGSTRAVARVGPPQTPVRIRRGRRPRRPVPVHRIPRLEIVGATLAVARVGPRKPRFYTVGAAVPYSFTAVARFRPGRALRSDRRAGTSRAPSPTADRRVAYAPRNDRIGRLRLPCVNEKPQRRPMVGAATPIVKPFHRASAVPLPSQGGWGRRQKKMEAAEAASMRFCLIFAGFG